MEAHKSCDKKLLKIEIIFGEDYADAYASEFLTAIKDINDDRYGILSNKSLKLLTCRYNSFLDQIDLTI